MGDVWDRIEMHSSYFTLAVYCIGLQWVVKHADLFPEMEKHLFDDIIRLCFNSN